MRSRRLRYLARLGLSALALAALAARVDARALLGAGARIDPRWIAAAVVLLAAATAVRAWSFMLVTNHRGRVIGFAHATYLTLVGAAASLVVPSGMGELVKAHVAGKTLDAPEHLAVSTVLDKITSLVAVAIMGTAGSLLLGAPAFALASATLSIASLVLLLVPRLIPWRLLTKAIALRADVRTEALQDAIAIPRPLLAGVVAVSVLGWTLTYAMVYACVEAAGVRLPPLTMLAIGPVMTIAGMLPISLAGIGVSQATLAAMLVAQGVPEPIATRAALVQLPVSLLAPLAGAALYALRGSEPVARSGREAYRRGVTMLTTVFPRFEGDGTGNFVLGAARAVAGVGWCVTVVAPHAPGLARAEHVDEVEVERFRYLPDPLERLGYGALGLPEALRRNCLAAAALPFFALGFWRAARRAAQDSQVVHAHFAPVGAIAAAASRRRAPLVVTLHGTDVALARRGGIWRAALRYACTRASLVVPVSETMAQQVRELVPGLPAERIAVIGNGIDASLLSRTVPDEQRSGIVFVGRLTQEKGAFDLVRALALLPEPVSATMIGAGDPTPLERLATSLAVRDRIIFTGPLPHDETLEHISQAAVFALPSYSEGCPVSVLEAAALGTPVVASAVGAIADILGGDEWLLSPGETSALARLLSRALEDRVAASSAAARARANVAARFTWAAVGQALVSSYERVSDPR
ncbi:MAG: lysylphosphatidylglycerol synthase domain-containing protein [Coriobacteriia bacterium]|nr:lysylphosphatidylglycerol synthase domain-containing protein [Coriobacteriia bacterium]